MRSKSNHVIPFYIQLSVCFIYKNTAEKVARSIRQSFKRNMYCFFNFIFAFTIKKISRVFPRVSTRFRLKPTNILLLYLLIVLYCFLTKIPSTTHTIKTKDLSRVITMMFTSQTKDGKIFLDKRVVENWKRSASVTAEEVVACLFMESTENMVALIKMNIVCFFGSI